jgi:hypothetical protein
VRIVVLALALALAVAPVRSAWSEVRAGAAIGAGGQGAATYSGLELRLDGDWSWLRLGLGARAVWLDGELRDGDWERPADAIRALRLLEASGEVRGARLALAAGALAPAQLGHVADGYRATLDDRQRTGVRTALATPDLVIQLELDDVLGPEMIGGAASVRVTERHVVGAAVAVDPLAGEAALELSGARRWDREGSRVEVGGGLVGEPGHGAAVLGTGSIAIERASARWTATGELRAGTGSVGAAFGALHKIEREAIYAQARRGVGGAIAASAQAPQGWLAASLRARPGLGPLATVSAGAPASRTVQIGGWLAASRHDAAGAAELRVQWASRLASAIELARIYAPDAMRPAWTMSAWFAATTR